MVNFSKLLYLPLDIPNPPDIASKLDSIPYEEMIEDNYRTCNHIPIMTRYGDWTELSKLVPELVDWCEENLFTWAEKSRIMIITTQPYDHNATHIDCSPGKFNTWQHKFRYVLRGNVDSLYFVSKNTYQNVTQIDKPYMMSGRWPHAMHNNLDQTKYTLALGSPWEPDNNDEKYMKVLEKSYNKYQEYYMSFEELELPEDYENLFEQKYKTN